MTNAYAAYSHLLYMKSDALGLPLSGTFELTARCNFDCKMCYIHRRANDAAARQREWSAGRWLALAEECQRAGTLLLLLTGGEPFLRPDFPEIYSGCRRLGMMVSINTNGSLIDDAMVRFLAADPPARVNITLYGASPAAYEALCGDGAAYDRTVRAILGLQAAGVLVKINFSVTPYNRGDAPAVYRFARDHGLYLQAATYMFPPVRAREQCACDCDRLSPEDSAREQLLYDRSRFSVEELRARWEAQRSGVRVEDPDRECQELPTERIRCRAGSSTYWVTWDGLLRPCGTMVTPSVSLEQASFAGAWQTIHAARQEILVPAACTACSLKHVCDQCAAMCYAETGAYTGVPTYLCRRTQAYLELIRQALEQLPPPKN